MSQSASPHGHDHDHADGHDHPPGQGHDHSDHDHGDHDDHADGHDHDRGDHGHGGHGHDHHGHSHGGGGHVHAPASFGRAFLIGVILNLGFVVIEVVYGVLGGSVALMADGAHNLTDVLGLAAAWLASVLGRRRPTARFTYGMGRSTILAALFNAALLLLATGAILLEAVQRLVSPSPVAPNTVMVVAAIGILINAFTAWLFARGGKDDINIRGAFLHMAYDALVSLGVLLGALVIGFTGWNRIDPAISLVIAGVIVWGTWSLLRQSLGMSLDAVPETIEPQSVRGYLEGLPGVARIHDLHIWSMSTTETALTSHLVIPGEPPGDAFLLGICRELRKRFRIGHATIQIERDDVACRLMPEDVV